MKIEVDRTVGDYPLEDKIVVVTGGGSGISLAFVRRALAAGAKVLIADLKLTPEASSLVSTFPPTHIHFQETDVTNWTQLNSLITTSKSHFGAVPDVYVAGAGLFEPPWANFWEDTEEERYATLEVNVTHVIKFARIALRALAGADKKGVFLSIASGAGFRPTYQVALYCATKFAVVGFTRSLRPAEVLEGVKVVTICPGAVDTPLWTEEKRGMLGGFPKIEVDDVAKSMMALIQEGRYKGGTVMMINQGENGAVSEVAKVVEEEDEASPMLMLKKGDDLPPMMGSSKAMMDKERGAK